MDKKGHAKTEIQKDGKILDDKKRDRGDTKKADNMKSKNDKTLRRQMPDRGDTITNKITHKTATKVDKKLNDKNKLETKPKLVAEIPRVYTEVDKSNKTEINAQKSKVGERKPISNKFSLKAKVLNNVNMNKDVKMPAKTEIKSDRSKNQSSLKCNSREVITDTPKADNTKIDTDVKKEKDTPVQRKATIKTVKTKNDKVYKAVTFTEQKRVKPTVLEINMPNIQAKKKAKLVDKNLETQIPNTQLHNNKSASKLSVKEKPHNRRNRLTERTKRKKLNRCISSPDKFKKVESPPTEVAKWAPSCISAHTKPYYEAWVNTTLAAITKISKKDKLFLEKQNIIKAFQKSLERAESPDLVHEDYANESYTGKIKIKHKSLKGKRQPLITPLLDKNFMKI